jgi:hypothetical protein
LIQKNENLSPDIKPSLYPADKNLPVDHFSLAGTQMPLYTYLLSLCSRSFKKAWSIQRNVAGFKKNFPLSSLGRERV